MTNTKSVFISYSSKDQGFANKVIRLLEKMGVSYWKAPEMIPAGSSYAREIPRAIRECGVFLLILSKDSQESIWVEKEVDSAICYRKSIVPVQIDEQPLNEMFRFYLNNVQTISYAENPKEAFFALQGQINRLLSGKPEKILLSEERPAEKPSGLFVEQEEVENNTGETDKKDTESFRMKPRSDVLSLNRIPAECGYCGGKLEKIARGTYQCMKCGKENYDDFQTVRNYLDKVGATPAVIIEQDTGVPRKNIEYFLRQEYLEIPKHSPIRMACEKCGAPIRTGYLCEQCKRTSFPGLKLKEDDVWRSSR